MHRPSPAVGYERTFRTAIAKPGAQHGLAPEAEVQRWQRRFTPPWRRIGGGSRLDREMDALIPQRGLTLSDPAAGDARRPRLLA